MTTPLGGLDVTARDGRRVTRRPGGPARPTSRSPSTSTARGTADVATGVGFYDHLLDVVRPPRPLRPRGPRRPATSRSTSTTPSRTSRWSSAPPWPRRSATGPGIARFGEASRPHGRGARDGRRRRRRAARTPSSTSRSGASGSARSRRSSSTTPSRRSPGPPASRSTCGRPGATTTTWPRPRSRRWPARCGRPSRPIPRRAGVASTKGSLG